MEKQDLFEKAWAAYLMEYDYSDELTYPSGKNRQSEIADLACLMADFAELEDIKYLTVSWIAGRLGVSDSYVVKCFKKFFGSDESLRWRISRRKCELAVDMLTYQPDMSIEKISEALDFGSPTYFIKSFKSLKGGTPLQYRKLAREKLEKTEALRELCFKIQRSINKTIKEETGGKIENAVHVHGGIGKLTRKPLYVEFLAPGFVQYIL